MGKISQFVKVGLAFNDGRMFFTEFRGKGCGDGPLYQ